MPSRKRLEARGAHLGLESGDVEFRKDGDVELLGARAVGVDRFADPLDDDPVAFAAQRDRTTVEDDAVFLAQVGERGRGGRVEWLQVRGKCRGEETCGSRGNAARMRAPVRARPRR